MVVIAIDEQTHKVTASITDGAITKAKLETEVQTALNKAHEHANKALLDTYDQTNANIKDAVSKKHSHANAAELDKIATGDKAKWDATSTKVEGIAEGATKSRPAPPKAILRSMAWRPRSLPSPPTLRSLRC